MSQDVRLKLLIVTEYFTEQSHQLLDALIWSLVGWVPAPRPCVHSPCGGFALVCGWSSGPALILGVSLLGSPLGGGLKEVRLSTLRHLSPGHFVAVLKKADDLFIWTTIFI
jgi:hypothetical protein